MPSASALSPLVDGSRLPFASRSPAAAPGGRTQTSSRLPGEKLHHAAAVNDVHAVLEAARERDPQSAHQLLPLVYEELRSAAARRLAGQPPGQTLQPTALVHEAFLRLTANGERTWADRRHFFASASAAMRHILVDRARRKTAVRHGGGQVAVAFDELVVAARASDEQLVIVNDALERLAADDPAAAELVELRFFGGFTLAQAAEIVGVSERTGKRLWAYARAWLFEEIQRQQRSAG